jgi:hypothetical protein
VPDVGAFDGFYGSWRGPRRAARFAINNERYVDWVCARFGVTLPGGVGSRAIAGLVGSRVSATHGRAWRA